MAGKPVYFNVSFSLALEMYSRIVLTAVLSLVTCCKDATFLSFYISTTSLYLVRTMAPSITSLTQNTLTCQKNMGGNHVLEKKILEKPNSGKKILVTMSWKFLFQNFLTLLKFSNSWSNFSKSWSNFSKSWSIFF